MPIVELGRTKANLIVILDDPKPIHFQSSTTQQKPDWDSPNEVSDGPTEGKDVSPDPEITAAKVATRWD
jgi:hypothetical protein